LQKCQIPKALDFQLWHSSQLTKNTKVVIEYGSSNKSTKKGSELAEFDKGLKVDKDFGEEDVANEVELDENT
jgi:hypothetical protein